MGTIVKFIEDAYPHGCVGDVRNLADKELAEVKKLAKSRGRTLIEEVKAEAVQVESEIKLTADTLKQYVKAHTRVELNQEATTAGVEEPEKLPNATAVAQAILDKKAA